MGNERIQPPDREGYHLTEDLVDHAIGFVRTQKSLAPEKPFFLYLGFGATHAPHHAPKEFIEKYRGRFDDGWDAVRERVFARQKKMGIVPPDTELAPRNDGVKAWAELTDNERRLFARMQEVFAGFLDHTDTHIGRLLDVPRGDRAVREHADRADLRQRREPGGRPHRPAGADLLQRHHRHQRRPQR